MEEFSPDPPSPPPNPGAMWAGLILVAVAVLGGIGVFWLFTAGGGGKEPPRPRPVPEIASPVRLPSVVEVTDEAIRTSSAKGLALAVTDVATSESGGLCRWAGRIVLANGGGTPIVVEAPDAGNLYVEVETAEGVRVRSRQESKGLRRVSLIPGGSAATEWRDDFEAGVKRFRFVYVGKAGGETCVAVTPWIEIPK